MAKHFAITINGNGQAVKSPLKRWVESNFHQLPSNFREGTTGEYRRWLQKIHWKKQIADGIVYLIQPDQNGSFTYADNYVDELQIESEDSEDEMQEAEEMAFGLEKDLQDAVRKNIQQLEEGLEIIDGGKERYTVAGFIDITAKDHLGRIVIIELKSTTAKPEVIAQTLAYMEAVQQEDKKDVRGIIVANDFGDRVKLASRQSPNLKLIKYSFQFSFNNIE